MEIINNIVNRLLIKYPLFGNTIANLEFIYEDSDIPAPAYTDGKHIYYTQDFLDNYIFEEKIFIIAHEVFHVALNHLFRNIGKDTDLLNYVEDAIINQLLIRDGLKNPKDLVIVPDALEYSTEELYMRYLPQLEETKKWMKANTYHVVFDVDDILKEMLGNQIPIIMDENQEIREELINKLQKTLKYNASIGMESLGITLPSEPLGTAKPLLSWKDILVSKLISPDNKTTSFYEFEMDGVIRKEEKNDCSLSSSEIVIDSSGSMNPNAIKAILRECKNILDNGEIRVGFCDIEFYGWNDINTKLDLDKISIRGRGGTDFLAMTNSFSKNADNKIVITDGFGQYPSDRPDVLWIILKDNYYSPYVPKDINCIYIDEKELEESNNKMYFKKTR